MTPAQATTDAARLRLDLEQLEPIEWTALDLIYRLRLTHAQVARRLSLPELAVRSLVGRAMFGLAELMRHDGCAASPPRREGTPRPFPR